MRVRRFIPCYIDGDRDDEHAHASLSNVACSLSADGVLRTNQPRSAAARSDSLGSFVFGRSGWRPTRLEHGRGSHHEVLTEVSKPARRNPFGGCSCVLSHRILALIAMQVYVSHAYTQGVSP